MSAAIHIRTFFSRYFAVLVVGVTYVWSMVSILSYRAQQTPPGAIVLHIGHWQLEAGVRDGLDQLAAKYREIEPNVYIVQDAIPEGTYGQWLTTQVMGGTASDIVEVGMLPAPLLLSFHSRYFMPLTAACNQPNPYNRGTPLAGVPWRKTYKDGMRSGYIPELQAYTMVPLSQFATRIIYNRDLLKKLTGRDTPPANYREFLSVCDTISRQRDAAGRSYVPIAMSGYNVTMWDTGLCEPLTFPAVRRIDFNRDGAVGTDELYTGIKTERISFDFPPYAARFKMLREITRYAPTGFVGLGRNEAVFLFAQQRAVFITAGTYDAYSLREQAQGNFDIGVMAYPAPTPDDPEFGRFMEGPIYDVTSTGFAFAISRTCRHPEVALDFLQFISSQRGNEELNRTIGWIPCIRGAKVSPELAPFEPHLEGIYPAMPVLLGGDTTVKWQQLYQLYLVDQLSYADFTAQFGDFYREHGPAEFEELQRNQRRTMERDEQLYAALRARALLAQGADAAARWINYRNLETDRLLVRDLPSANLRAMLAQGPVINAVGPYQFTDEALQNVRRHLADAGRGGK